MTIVSWELGGSSCLQRSTEQLTQSTKATAELRAELNSYYTVKRCILGVNLVDDVKIVRTLE